MEKLSMCRICMNKEVRMHCLLDTNLQEIYELLTGKLLETKDPRPVHACYVCCARLRNCLQLRSACLRSEELFTHMFENNDCEVTQLQNMRTLRIVAIIHLSVDPGVHKDPNGDGYIDDNILRVAPLALTDDVHVKEEHIEDMQNNYIIDKGICNQSIKQENMKSENVISEYDELDYNIQGIQAEANSASDKYCLGNDTIESYISKSNHSISSVKLQDIYDKTITMVLHRKDMSHLKENAIVTKELKGTDLVDTSPSTNLNNLENKDKFKTNISEDSKKLVNLSSEKQCSPQSDSLQYIGILTGEKPYKCSICGKCFEKKRYLSAHILRHKGEKTYKCGTCGKNLSSKSNLTKHLRMHSDVKLFKCSTCGKGYNEKSNLTNHIRTHTGDKPYKCDTCEKCFYSISRLREHVHIHAEERPYKCDICGKRFNQKSNLYTHVRTHTGEKPYKCDACDKCFSSASHLSKHVLVHSIDKPHKCSTCGKGFKQKGNLSIHVRTHTGEKPYKCDFCDKRFRTNTQLSKHFMSNSHLQHVGTHSD